MDHLVLNGRIAILVRHSALRYPIVEITPVAVHVLYAMNALGAHRMELA